MIMADGCYAEGHNDAVSQIRPFMLCLYAECRYAECFYAVCHGTTSEYLSIEQTKDFLQV
jgi:hypothetical protein